MLVWSITSNQSACIVRDLGGSDVTAKSMFSVAAAILWGYNVNVIKVIKQLQFCNCCAQLHKTSRNENAFYDPRTTWCRNAVNIDMMKIVTSPHPVYRRLKSTWSRHVSTKRRILEQIHILTVSLLLV